jgi:thiol-disulfide isomerase/thioredoxin
MTQFRRSFAALFLAIAMVSVGVRAAGPPTSIVPVSEPTGLVFETEIGYLTVQVTDADGNMADFSLVKWQGPAAGPRARLTPFLGDDGASVALQPIGGYGTYQITATVDGVGSVTFERTNVAEPLRVVAGANRSTLVNTMFVEPIVVQTRTLDGNPLGGVRINFTAASSGASAVLQATFATTDANGLVSMPGSANGIAGLHYVIAATSLAYSSEQRIQLSNLAAAPVTLQYVSGSDQTLSIGGSSREVKVRVGDAGGLPMKGVAVDFGGPTVGPGLGGVDSPSRNIFPLPGGGRVITDNDGLGTLAAFANSDAGPYVLSASVLGIANTVDFNLTNVTRTIGAILPGGAPQAEAVGVATPVGGRFDTIHFRVVDSDGLSLPNVTITLTPPVSGASVVLDQSVIVSDSDGWATTSGTANQSAGPYYYLRADAPGLEQPAYLLMQNRAPGFAIGEQISTATGLDHAGVSHSLRSFLTGSNYLIIDVCAKWCTFCQAAQPGSQAAQSQLAAIGIPLTVVPLLAQSLVPGEPSTQLDASQWRAHFAISDPVLHVSGNLHSELSDAAGYVLGATRPGFPTYLLIAPDGTIVDRHVGSLYEDGVMDFVLNHVPIDLSITGSVSVTEGSAATLSVTRSRAGYEASVAYATTPGTATAADFTSRTGKLLFASDQLTATITFPTTNDTTDEPSEQFKVTLSDAPWATIAQGQATVTIVDNDAPSAISIDDERFTEGSSGTTTARVDVRLDRPSAFQTSVQYSTIAGSAKAADVALTNGKVIFLPGQTVQQIAVAIVGDKLGESKETFTIRLSSPESATIDDNEATISIVDDDGDTQAPVIAAKSDVVVEVKMVATSSVVVNYAPPTATDNRDGFVAVVCEARTGETHGYGTEAVTCTAEDRAGNLASRPFNIIVRLPTVPGALFDPHDRNRTTPLTEAHRDDRVLVHVNAGAFDKHAKVNLTFVDASGRRHDLCDGKADKDGSLDEIIEIPRSAAQGVGQVLAESQDGKAEYDRAWFLTVVKKHRH